MSNKQPLSFNPKRIYLIFRPLILAYILISNVVSLPALAQLGDADNAISGTIPNKIYDALCGTKENEKRCKVEFKNGKLLVNDSEGITRKDALYLRTKEECKRGSFFGIPNCYPYQYVTTSMLTYRRTDGSEGVATFSFLNPSTSVDFHQDLTTFMQGRPDKGILTIESGR